MSIAKKKRIAPAPDSQTRLRATINEMRGGRETAAESLIRHAEQIEEHLGLLHAAVLHMQGAFVAPPGKACEMIDDAIAGIRFETAQMRRAHLGIE